MKNIEKHIDVIAKWVADYMGCAECPCRNECKYYVSHDANVIGCKEFFKRWSLEECDDGNNDKIKGIIIKAVETLTNAEIAETYSHTVSCKDCPYWHECCKEYTCCYYHILDKLEGDDGKEN